MSTFAPVLSTIASNLENNPSLARSIMSLINKHKASASPTSTNFVDQPSQTAATTVPPTDDTYYNTTAAASATATEQPGLETTEGLTIYDTVPTLGPRTAVHFAESLGSTTAVNGDTSLGPTTALNDDRSLGPTTALNEARLLGPTTALSDDRLLDPTTAQTDDRSLGSTIAQHDDRSPDPTTAQTGDRPLVLRDSQAPDTAIVPASTAVTPYNPRPVHPKARRTSASIFGGAPAFQSVFESVYGGDSWIGVLFAGMAPNYSYTSGRTGDVTSFHDGVAHPKVPRTLRAFLAPFSRVSCGSYGGSRFPGSRAGSSIFNHFFPQTGHFGRSGWRKISADPSAGWGQGYARWGEWPGSGTGMSQHVGRAAQMYRPFKNGFMYADVLTFRTAGTGQFGRGTVRQRGQSGYEPTARGGRGTGTVQDPLRPADIQEVD